MKYCKYEKKKLKKVPRQLSISSKRFTFGIIGIKSITLMMFVIIRALTSLVMMCRFDVESLAKIWTTFRTYSVSAGIIITVPNLTSSPWNVSNFTTCTLSQLDNGSCDINLCALSSSSTFSVPEYSML